MSYVLGLATAAALAAVCYGVWHLLGFPLPWEAAVGGSAITGWIMFYRKGRDT